MKTLILYASNHGITAQCAEQLQKRLGGTADLIRLTKGKAPDLSAYDTVILGGSIYAGGLQKAMKAFAAEHTEELLSKKLGLFISCMSPEEDVPQLKANFPSELVTHASAVARLGGGFLFSKMNFIEKGMISTISKSEAKKQGTVPEFDGKTDFIKISESGMEKMVSAMR